MWRGLHLRTVSFSGEIYMTRWFLVSLALCGFAAISAPAFAGPCPTAGREEKLKLLEQASSCQDAARLFKLCAIGAAFDGELALSVNGVCEKRSLAKLPGKERHDYEAAIDACNERYVAKRGSIYRSAAAHCRVEVMARVARDR
jgi:hypothetical protein